MATTSSNQGAREVYGAIAARLETPNGDSAMDDTNDAVKVVITGGAGSGGTSAADGSAYSAGTTAGTPVMAARDDVGTTALAEDKVGIVRATSARALHVNLRDASGTEITTLGGGTQYNEDDAHTSGDKVTMAGAVRKDTAASLAGTDGDITIPIVDASGRLWVNASGAAVPVTDNSSTLSIDDGAGSITVDGTVAATQSGTWTVQPGNTANTTPWLATISQGGNAAAVSGSNALKVDGSAVVQPVSLYTSSTASAPATVTVNGSSGLVITSNANRKGLILVNTSTSGQRISLHMANGTAVLDSGVTLWPGDTFEMGPNSFTTAVINGIASAASGTLGVQEFA